MVNAVPRFLLAFALLLFLEPASARCRVFLPADTTLLFNKMPADTVVVKKKPEPKVARKKPAAKKSSVAPKKVAAKAAVEKKTDSVAYSERKYSLGDRVIMRGDTGADVKKLAEIMVKNLYIDEKAVPYTKSGAVLYDGELLRAVKLFQKVSGLYDDGIVGTTTIKELRKIHRWRRTSN